ncbi:MAG: zinc-dependent metalloprotease [Gemmatimonadota bacterium]
MKSFRISLDRYIDAVTRLAYGCLAVLVVVSPATGQDQKGANRDEGIPSIEAKTASMDRIDGFVPLYWDATKGGLWMELSRFDTELLHYVSLPAGIGSNDLGLDRGQLGPQAIVEFRRVGPRILMVEPNYEYRALSENPAERRAVRDAFAESVLWGFEVAAETEGRVLVDATDFLIRDAHGVARGLEGADQGTYALSTSRSALYLPRTKGFPKNTEIEVTLTFTSEAPEGSWVRSVTPRADAVTVRQHFSFVELPEPGFEPREALPGAGYFGPDFVDYASPLGEPLVTRLIARHRLEKRDPGAAVSEPVDPIVYHLDPGTPEPVRSALLEGARWWDQAFEAAGYRGAFRVEMLAEDADPMDLRYNVIQWVHRSTRGWSYGMTVSDPRTGEILKGHVSLGSLRVRQDYLIAEALLAPYEDGDEVSAEVEAMALARIRQLSAHEVGHTLGLTHNYIASTQGRASVMDYPHPYVWLDEDGAPDVTDAYATGIGEWDKVAIAYGYQDFPSGADEEAALKAILSDARAEGITFLADQDARPTGSAHPEVHLWDNGSDAVTELGRVMEVRQAALARFGSRVIREGQPLATIEEALVPLFLYHRYQVEAAIKVIGGVRYQYSLRGDGLAAPQMVGGGEQRRALETVLHTLDLEELAIPEEIWRTLPPRPFRYPAHRELFDRYTGTTFDVISPAVAVTEHVTRLLLDEERAARLVEQAALDPSLPDLGEVLDALRKQVFAEVPDDPYLAEIQRAAQRVVVDRLLQQAAAARMPQVRAVTEWQLVGLRDLLTEAHEASARRDDAGSAAHCRALASDIGRYLDREGDPTEVPGQLRVPPGSPIG